MRVAPMVPPKTMSMADGASSAAGLPPSINIETRSAPKPTPRPMSVERSILALVLRFRHRPVVSLAHRIPALHGQDATRPALRDLVVVIRDALHHVGGALAHQQFLMVDQRHHRVWCGLDEFNEFDVDVKVCAVEACQFDHCGILPLSLSSHS